MRGRVLDGKGPCRNSAFFFLSWKETCGRFGTVKSETTPVQVTEDVGYIEKWVDSEYGLMAEPMAFLGNLEGMVRERGGKDNPNVGLRD